MREFALIFRQGTRKLTEEDLQKRTEKVRGWAIALVEEGRLTYSRILGEEIRRTSAATPDGEGATSAFTIVQAETLEEAFALAKTFPGIEYGVSVEVREATNPAGPPK